MPPRRPKQIQLDRALFLAVRRSIHPIFPSFHSPESPVLTVQKVTVWGMRMVGKSIGKFAKSNSESEMSTTALLEGRKYYDKLMDAEYRGRKDRNGSARGRLADLLMVSETKLLRLEYKIEEMRDIGGELYRRLKLGYEAICEGNEQAAEAMRAERLKLKAVRDAVHKRRAVARVGSDPARD
jgi:hypothetical protein